MLRENSITEEKEKTIYIPFEFPSHIMQHIVTFNINTHDISNEIRQVVVSYHFGHVFGDRL